MYKNQAYSLNPLIWGAATFVIGVFFTLLIAQNIQRENSAALNLLAKNQTITLANEIETSIELFQYGLRGGRGHILSKSETGITRAAFHKYMLTRDIDDEFPGARGMGFIRRVPVAQEAEFLAHARADGWPDFTIKQLAPHDKERYVIQYIEPVARNVQAVGLDIGSETSRRTAAEAALRTGDVQITAPITLVQATGKSQQSFLILMPIYRTWATPATEEERMKEAIGWSYAPLITEEVLAKLTIDRTLFNISLTDVTEASQPVHFYSSSSEAIHSDDATLFSQHIVRSIYGRQWQLDLQVTPLFVKQQHLPKPRNTVFWGLLISALSAMLAAALYVYLRSRQQIINQQARLAAIVKTSTDAIIVTDIDDQVLSWNKGAETIFGYTESSARGAKVRELITPPDLRKENEQLIEYLLQGLDVIGFETKRQRQDGVIIDVSLNYSPLRNEKGEIIGFSKTLRDISEQKTAQTKVLELNYNLEQQVIERTQELTTAKDQLIIAADMAELGVWRFDTTTGALDWNDRMFAIYEQPLSLRESGLFYQHWAERLHPDDAQGTQQLLEKTLAGTGSFKTTFRLVLPSKDIRYIQAVAEVEKDSHGKIIRIMGINRDITNQQRIENHLREAKQKADSASAAKSSFLANMSHEIRTPMNAVLGMLQLVQKTQLNSRQQDYITKAESSAKSLLGLLNDILDFSKMESGKLSFDAHPFEFEELMSELSVLLAANHGDKEVEVLFQLDPNVPRQLFADRLRLQQILTNLASNALKFTAQGHVIISVSCLEKNPTQAHLRFAVTDTGIGISEEQQTRIFNGFEQAESSTTRRFGGTGLGLVISKRLVNMMGGELQLTSELGKGSRFWFDIDLAVADPTPYAEFTHESFTKIRVLVVDDNPLVADILQQTLSALGFATTHTNSGSAAIEAVELAHTKGTPFDVVLMDWRMPEVDGLSAAQSISSNKRLSKQPVIIMVTAYEREVLANQSEPPVPYQELLTKPVTPHQLAKSIWQNVTGKPLASTIADFSEQQTTPLQGLRLLVVEDNALNRQIAQELLEAAGAHVELAEGGVEGINKVTTSNPVYDLVIMDIQMPDMDGFEATGRIREHSNFAHLPILAMTANASAADKEACLTAGMNGHVGKPIDMDQLVSQILHLLKREVIPTDNPSAPSDPLTPIDNTQTILKRFGNNQDLFARMLNNFRPEIMRLLDSLALHCDNKDLTDSTAVLHSLKGVASTMGAKLLAQTAAILEAQCKQAQEHELNDIVSGATREKLLQIFESSEPLLLRIAHNKTTIAEPRSTSLSDAQIRQQLKAILPLLEADNMGAIDLIETLCEQAPEQQLIQISTLINALDYVQAIALIQQFLQESNE